MADEIVTTVKDVQVETKQRKDGTGSFETVSITGDTGLVFSGYVGKDLTPPTRGSRVMIRYQSVNTKTGGFNKILKVTDAPTETTKAPETKRTTCRADSNFNPTNVTLKDVSMEVSGLLQAIITKHGLSDSTSELLEEALQIKANAADKRAKELGIS